MFLLGEKETTPTKATLKKILDYLKDKKYPFLITLLAAGLVGLFVDVEKQLNKAQKAIKHLLVQQLIKHLKNELQVQLLKTANDILHTMKNYLLHIAIVITVVFVISYSKWNRE